MLEGILREYRFIFGYSLSGLYMMKKIISALIFLICLSGLSSAQTSAFQPSYSINKARATVHYFFSNFEKNPRQSREILAMLSPDGFALVYPWGEYKTKTEVKNWINSLPNEFVDAHHIQDITITQSNDSTVTAVADVIWQNLGPDNRQDRARLSYAFELVDTGAGLLKIKSLNCRRVE